MAPTPTRDREVDALYRALDALPRNATPMFVVAAPESMGNRYVVSLLVAAGCYGVSGHVQPFDVPRRRSDAASWVHEVRVPHAAAPRPRDWPASPHRVWPPPCYVMHRSLPHNKQWVSLVDFARRLAVQGVEPRVVTTRRMVPVAALSQRAAREVRTLAEAYVRIERATLTLADARTRAPRVRHVELLYSAFAHREYVRWALHRCGFSHDDVTRLEHYGALPEFRDRDAARIGDVVA